MAPAHNDLHFEGTKANETVVSGGINIDPASWAMFAAAACPGCCSIMRAPLPPGTTYSRQFYVNGVRANWTMALFPQAGAKVTQTG